MSSFYGNIKFNNQTPLIYDKIYTSRYQMEQECHSDGIFNGRYILISYGDIRYTPYHKVEPMNEADFANAIKAGNIYYITDSQSADGFKSTTEYKAGQDYYIRTIYSIDEGSTFAKNKSIDEQYYNHDYHSTVWQKIWTSTQDSAEIEEKYIMVSHLNAETPKVTMIVDAPNDVMEFDKTNQVYFLVPTNQHALNIPGVISKEDFDKNREKLFIKSEEMFDGEYIFSKVSEDAEWNIDTVYYIYKNEVYEKYPDSKPYGDGMISEELYINLTQDRKIPLFVFHNKDDFDEIKNMSAGKFIELVENNFSIYATLTGIKYVQKPQYQYNDQGQIIGQTMVTVAEEVVRRCEISSYPPRIPVGNNDLHGAAIGAPYYIKYEEDGYYLTTNWDRLTKYYFMRYRETEGRPHFDPIMSTDLEYRFHMPRNWKWDNELDFEYNHAGFNPAKVSDTNTQENEITLTTKASGDTYPEHRFDEPSAARYDKDLNIIKSVQPDTKRFRFDLSMLGDAVSKMWDEVYPRVQKNDPDSERNMFIGNDRDPANEIDYPGTLAEAVRKLYYWLGIKSDNNFVQGPWIDPNTKEEVDTIFGVLNGASDLLGSFGDTFKDELFIPIASPYYPDGYNHLKEDDGFTQLTLEEFELLHNGGAGPLYIQKEDGSYEQAIEYDYNKQYYRNMNSLLALLRAWQDIVKDTQADWTYDVGHIEWDQNNPLHPRFIRNKPMVLTVDKCIEGELYEIKDPDVDLNVLLNESRLFGDFYYRYQVQVTKYRPIYNQQGIIIGHQPYTISEDREATIRKQILNFPINLDEYYEYMLGAGTRPTRFTGVYYEKHILDPASINWYWKNYAL